MSERRRGTVLLATGGFFDVLTGQGVVRCRMRGRLKKERRKTDLCVIGDEVEVRVEEGGVGTLEEVLPRRSRFSRQQPGRGGARFKEDVLVANLDQVVIVFSFGTPPLRPRMLDRFLVIAEHNHVEAVIVCNKVDAETGPETRDLLESYRALGYRVLYTSARTGAGIDALGALLEGRLSALTGPSGAGKSSLINAIHPELDLRVGGTSDAHGKGRHTTRVATLHPLPGGGFVADTPGIRELGAFEIPKGELASCFPEMRPFLGRCAFRSCEHIHEPGCEVMAAVDRGEISEARYDSYTRLHEDEERPERAG